jgi:hypothetical protein
MKERRGFEYFFHQVSPHNAEWPLDLNFGTSDADLAVPEAIPFDTAELDRSGRLFRWV